MNPDLSQLHDIHLPKPVSWWPPAIGWWLLLVLLLALIVLGYWLYRRHQRQQWRRDALAELQRLKQQCSGKELVVELSILLRRVAITRFPREEVAALTGDRWLAFLDHTLDVGRGTKLPLPHAGEGRGEGGKNRPSFQKNGRALITVPYSNSIDIDDAQQLCTLVEKWIKEVAR